MVSGAFRLSSMRIVGQPRSVNGTHLTRIQTNQNTENVNSSTPIGVNLSDSNKNKTDKTESYRSNTWTDSQTAKKSRCWYRNCSKIQSCNEI